MLIKVKVYLTPNGHLPDNEEDWIPMSHAQIIEKGLELLKSGNLGTVTNGNCKRILIGLAIGPYQITEEILGEMNELAK